eukprot:CAMPEP_0115839528 /NCGR_PEP_ID=MMETSP0287-20121206/6299_2 /TAXON_ID=412157 /ORGANISM="Chrysochromulina rotalis, Strain UIO044" /LENGTH=128 /DNA_ID=CAMNT_0003293105 /DNA_START=615 /DNA_END=1002 /DNA_ORIENTATION=-
MFAGMYCRFPHTKAKRCPSASSSICTSHPGDQDGELNPGIESVPKPPNLGEPPLPPLESGRLLALEARRRGADQGMRETWWHPSGRESRRSPSDRLLHRVDDLIHDGVITEEGSQGRRRIEVILPALE